MILIFLRGMQLMKNAPSLIIKRGGVAYCGEKPIMGLFTGFCSLFNTY